MVLSVSFGSTDASIERTDNILAKFNFGGAASFEEYDFQTGMPQLGSGPVYELWSVPGSVRRLSDGDARLAISENYCLSSVEVPANCGNIRDVSRDAYNRVFDTIQEQDFPHIVKTWNYVPAIHSGGEDDDECYKQFCIGRGESYAQRGLNEDCMPAGTAVGVDETQPLRVYVLSSHHSVAPIENPRQTSAFRYPRQYGPQSPSFSRAICLQTDRLKQFFLSGTASISGHISQHIGNLERQVDETVKNIKVLIDAANLDDVNKRFALSTGRYRVYVKQPEMRDVVVEMLKASGLDPANMVVVQADICRRELLVELDGIFDSAVNL